MFGYWKIIQVFCSPQLLLLGLCLYQAYCLFNFRELRWNLQAGCVISIYNCAIQHHGLSLVFYYLERPMQETTLKSLHILQDHTKVAQYILNMILVCLY